MIEFSRYMRLKPLGVVRVVEPSAEGLTVEFKRFDNETGKELADPERCYVTFSELETKKAEILRDLEVIMELLRYIR